MTERSAAGRLLGGLGRAAPHLVAFLAAAAALALVVARLPAPVVERMIESDFRAGAQLWQMRILRQLTTAPTPSRPAR